ncbi:MAG: hypothetical protein K5678_11330, partial [Acetatifactor sp.]|nr:hypothetical protein [Acetatifactor sp.]
QSGTGESSSAQTSESHSSEGAYELVIKKGYSSWTVAKILAADGIVEDAKAFDTYLCRNGYDKRISVGTFFIAEGSDEETIAKLITNSK